MKASGPPVEDGKGKETINEKGKERKLLLDSPEGMELYSPILDF